MKNSHSCPKCQGTEISHVEGMRAPVKIKTGVSSNATIALYICLSCGYLEQWIDSKVDLGDLRSMFPPKKPA